MSRYTCSAADSATEGSVGDDDRHRFADVAHTIAGDDGLEPEERHGRLLAALHSQRDARVGERRRFGGGERGDDARERLRGGQIHPDHGPVGDRAPHDARPDLARPSHIGDVFAGACSSRRSSVRAMLLPTAAPAGAVVTKRSSLAEPRDRPEDRLVAGAAAQVRGEQVPDAFRARRRLALENPDGQHHEARGAEAALKSVAAR